MMAETIKMIILYKHENKYNNVLLFDVVLLNFSKQATYTRRVHYKSATN